MKRTALYEKHKQLHAKLVPFSGWEMPISYEGVLAEHKAVREACGVFDVSHMGEIFVTGQDAEAYLQSVSMNDIKKLSPGQSQYTAILNPEGGFVDDLIIYRLWDGDYLICANASNIEKDYAWLKSHTGSFQVQLRDESAAYAQLAVQGPYSLPAVASVLPESDLATLKDLSYTHIMRSSYMGTPILLARTGYTGEKGFELYVPNAVAGALWDALLASQETTGIKPIGLGARDTLRLEACYLLYGNDMNDTISPLEAGVAWAVRFDAGDFIGKRALETQKASGLKRKLVAFKMVDDAIPRAGMEIFANDKAVGKVMSGSVLPTVGGAGGLCLVEIASAAEGSKLEIDVRGKRRLASVVKRPLYQAKVK